LNLLLKVNFILEACHRYNSNQLNQIHNHEASAGQTRECIFNFWSSSIRFP